VFDIINLYQFVIFCKLSKLTIITNVMFTRS